MHVVSKRATELIGCLFLSAAACLWSLTAGDNEGRKIAVLIGVNKYDGLRNLDYAEKDVTALGAVLEKMGYKVTLLTWSERNKREQESRLPNARNIREQLEAALRDRRPEDTVLVAFSGHGAHLKETNKLYFCPVGTNLEPVGKNLTAQELLAKKEESLVAVDDVLKMLTACKAGSKVLMMDACRNDPADGRTAPNGSATRPLVPDVPGGIVAMFSCSKGQVAYESQKFEHGFLFYYLIEGLKGKAINKQGEVTWLELARYIERELPDAVRDEKGPKMVQTPEVKGEARGLVLGRPPATGDSSGSASSGKSNAPGSLKRLDSTRAAVPAAEAKAIQAAWAEGLGLKLPVEVDVGGAAMEFVLIPPGTFMMGSQRRVIIEKPFLTSVCEIKQSQYAALMEREKRHPSAFRITDPAKLKTELLNVKSTDDFPVESVTWDETQEFAAKLLAVCQNKFPGRTIAVRLPTEAEWELAARAGTTAPFQNDAKQLRANGANFGKRLKRTEECGRFPANPLGLHDVHGNVAEWCQDGYLKTLATFEEVDPLVEPKGQSTECVVRGGSWMEPDYNCTLSSRVGQRRDVRSDWTGFRVVLLLDPKK